MEQHVNKLRETFNTGKTKPLAFRKTQLRALLRFYEENTDAIVEAISKDLRKSKQEIITMEIKVGTNDLKDVLANLDDWAKPVRPSKSFVNWMDSVYIMKDPYGVVLVLGAWNYPLQLLLVPLVGAIAAGNCAVIKPSELAPATALLIQQELPKYLDTTCYWVMNGGVPETTELLRNRFDYIFYTGSTAVAKIIHKAANEHLTPVTLELGGKSPVYMDNTVNFKVALKRLLWGKYVNAGQTCIAPDYLVCTPEVQKKVLEMAPGIIEDFFGQDPQESPDLSRIVNQRHFKRVAALLQSGKVAIGGVMKSDELYISPTILSDCSWDDLAMKEEIFGPILPIVTVQSEDEALRCINNRDKPLALYIFSNNDATVWNFINNTSSGGVCVNDTVMHFVTDHLPFGGVGMSGTGRYHGRYSFDTFTHEKGCLYKDFNMIGENLAASRYPPYSESKCKFLSALISRRPSLPLGFLRYLFAFGFGLLSAYMFKLYTAQ